MDVSTQLIHVPDGPLLPDASERDAPEIRSREVSGRVEMLRTTSNGAVGDEDAFALAVLESYADAARPERTRRSVVAALAGLTCLGFGGVAWWVSDLRWLAGAGLAAVFLIVWVSLPPRARLDEVWALHHTVGTVPYDSRHALLIDFTAARAARDVSFVALNDPTAVAGALDALKTAAGGCVSVQTGTPASRSGRWQERAVGGERTLLDALAELHAVTRPASWWRETVTAGFLDADSDHARLVRAALTEARDGEATNAALYWHVDEAEDAVVTVRAMESRSGEALDVVLDARSTAIESTKVYAAAYGRGEGDAGTYADLLQRGFAGRAFIAYCPVCWEQGITDAELAHDALRDEWTCGTCRRSDDGGDFRPVFRPRLQALLMDRVEAELWKEKQDARNRVEDDVENQLRELNLREREAFERLQAETRQALRVLRQRIRDYRMETQRDAAVVRELLVAFDRAKLAHDAILTQYRTSCDKIESTVTDLCDRQVERMRKNEGKIEKLLGWTPTSRQERTLDRTMNKTRDFESRGRNPLVRIVASVRNRRNGKQAARQLGEAETLPGTGTFVARVGGMN